MKIYYIIIMSLHCMYIHLQGLFIRLFYKNIIYLSGPISSCMDTYKDNFKFAEVKTRKKNPKSYIYNPANTWYPKGLTVDQIWIYCMAICLSILPYCDTICMLPDWESSNGAHFEKKYFDKAKLNVIYINEKKEKKE